MLTRLVGILGEVSRGAIPILALLLIFQLVVLRKPLENWREMAIGFVFALIGLVALVYGLRYGILPLGSSVANSLVDARSAPLILLFAFLLGLTVTYAEPALLTMGEEMDQLTSGAVSKGLFLNTVAIGVALGTVAGTSRILFGVIATHYFIPVLAIVLVLTYFTPEKYTAIAFDAALATTGPITVTLVIALGTGLALALGRSEVLLYGFGLVTMAALGPILTVLILGIILGRLGM
ncbi:MAG: DUF1538 domain-containing protein [Candidatus Sericytochromatia bacterium]